MLYTTELSDFIRYQLSSLNSKNKHHEFEDMCYQFARLAISPNFLPATGPVSSGGDQGRDSETFQSVSQFSPPVSSEWSFADGRKAVIACSLEKKIKAKVESDVKKICEFNKPDAIYFFTNQDIPVAIRHGLQKWTEETYNVSLEIFDGHAIADQLTRSELFWIAQSYLNIPSEMYPRPKDDANEEYNEAFTKWVQARKIPQTFSDFFEIKKCIRQATFNNEKKIDLLEWIAALNRFPPYTPQTVLRRCKYEICVAALRGLNNLDQYASLVESYFSDIENINVNEIEDTAVLISYCSGAVLQANFNFDPATIHKWTVSLIERIEAILRKTTTSNSKCDLLSYRAYAATLPFRKSIQPSFDWTEAFKWWNRLLSEVKSAPLFPLDRFSNFITSLTPFIGDEPGYTELTEKLDELLTNRSHGYIAAEKCRDRAMEFVKQDRPIRAIHELHNAKIKWFTKETLRGTVLSLLMISRLYSELHLIWAAKYYALAAAYLIHKEDDDNLMNYFPDALIQLFITCYQGGEWLTCIDLLPLVNAAHFQYRSNPENFDEHEDFQSVIAHSIIIYHSNKKIGNLDIEGYFLNALEKWPLPNYLNTLIVTNENATEIWIDSAEPAQLLKSFTEELDGAPFSDAGKTRTFAWNALGIYWNLRCENAAEKISVIESLVSCLQIVIADLSEKDMILLPTTVNIEADCGLGLKMDFQEITGGKESNWRVQIPMSDSIEDFSTSLLTFATIMLTRCSLLPEDKCEKIIEEAFKKGLPSKTFIVRPYHELLQEFTHDNKEKDKNGIPRPEAEGFLFSHESKSLEWKSGPGPEYTKKKSQEHIANRYAKSIAPVRYSIPILNKSTEFQDFVASLRAQGYRDWHILLLIANVAFNKRHPSYIKSLPKSQDERSAIMSAFSREETTDDTPITMEDLKSIPIDMQLHIQLSAFCSTWQLDFKRQSPDFDALKRLLTERYGYMEDDIPHAPIFENRNSPEP